MRLLFASTRGAGHYQPLLPYAAACTGRGHEVLFAGPPELAEPIAAAGHAFWEFADPDPDELQAVYAEVPSLPPDGQNRVVVGEIFGRLNTQAALPRLRQALAEWRPDVVVREPGMFAAAIAADEHEVPHARVAITLGSAEEHQLEWAAGTYDPDLARATPWLTTWPERVDPATQPHTERFAPALPEPAALPDWWGGGEAPLVYATLGSVAGAMPVSLNAYGAIIAAVAPLGVRVLLTVGRELDPSPLPELPPHVHVEPWVPQHDVLPHAAVALSHGGSGSVLGALAAGVPQVVMPLFADQPLNAEAVAAAGVGVAVTPPRPDDLRAAIERVLAEPAFGETARAVAAEMAALPPLEAAVDRLAALA